MSIATLSDVRTTDILPSLLAIDFTNPRLETASRTRIDARSASRSGLRVVVGRAVDSAREEEPPLRLPPSKPDHSSFRPASFARQPQAAEFDRGTRSMPNAIPELTVDRAPAEIADFPSRALAAGS